MSLNLPSDDPTLSAEEQALADFNLANRPWQLKYEYLLDQFEQLQEGDFGRPIPYDPLDSEKTITLYKNGSDSWLIDVHISSRLTHQVQCDPDRLRVVHDGKHVFLHGYTQKAQNTQPIQPYHGAPHGEDGRQACRDIQAWLNPVVDYLVSRSLSKSQKSL